MDIFDEIFEAKAERVKATAKTPKDGKGITKTVKFTVAPGGEFDDDSEWLTAAEEGVTLTKNQRLEDGRSRSKSIKLEEDEAEESVRAVEDVLGVERKPKPRKRNTKADALETEPSENGATS